MGKWLLAFVLIFALLFSGCSKVDPPQEDDNSEDKNATPDMSDYNSAYVLHPFEPLSDSVYFGVSADDGNSILAAYENGRHYIERFDVKTGENTAVRALEDTVLSVERSFLDAYDFKIKYNDGAIEFLTIALPDAGELVCLPDSLRAKVKLRNDDYASYTTFDIDPINEVYVVSDIEGLHILSKSRAATIGRKEITADVLQGNYPQFSEHEAFGPRFGDVYIMNGGRTIAATIYIPNTQMKENGVMLYDVETKEIIWFANINEGMTGSVRYIDSNSIVTGSGIIDVEKGEIVPLKEEIGATVLYTCDGDVFVTSEYESLGADVDGMRIFRIDSRDEPLYQKEDAVGPSYFKIVSIGETYVLCRETADGKQKLVAIPYR